MMSNTRSLLLITALAVLLLPIASARGDQDGFTHSPLHQNQKTWVVVNEDGAQPIPDLTEIFRKIKFPDTLTYSPFSLPNR